ncbi:rhodanese-like domain-containing protein [Solimonas sp. K1W22B-7]|uniref:rhodanese-like domain-containing protein n=1 Tax=Solimonas sp. K1W22B-7 TaxID=2303331 RepID=UPI0013C4BC79|nr:rhodanese-like domain-containing protein [Solimonas sp. K1W22B-7]
MAWEDADLEHGRYSLPMPALVASAVEGKVLFVDTREPTEFRESHIPQAINIPLRDAHKADLAKLSGYQYVVPYCLKDLRAFEVAKSLQARGLTNVKMMEPSGFKGWQAQKLPVASPRQSDAQASEVLKAVAGERGWTRAKPVSQEKADAAP